MAGPRKKTFIMDGMGMTLACFPMFHDSCHPPGLCPFWMFSPLSEMYEHFAFRFDAIISPIREGGKYIEIAHNG
jgi:hypothetical protein